MTVSPISQPGNNAILPDAPTNIVATAVGGGGATISFTPSVNPGKGSANYVATSSPGGVTASAASSPITFNTGTLTAAQSYTFTVVKQSGSGITSNLSVASGSITAFYVPSAPTITSSSAGDGFLDISFTAGSANGSTITNYQYATSTNGTTYTSWTAFSPANITSPVRITGLTNGTNYYVKIRAVNTAGVGAESNVFRDGTNLTTQPFGVPLSATATLTDGCDIASWAFSATANGRSITEYTYQTSTNGGITWSGEVIGSSFSLNTSRSSSATVVRVKAKNAAGYGSYGSASSANATRTAGTSFTEYQFTCGNRQSRVATPWDRPGCGTNYSYTDWVSSPDCNSTCFTTSSAVISSRYTGSCNTRVRYDTTRTTYTAKAGTGCTTYSVDTEGGAIADPDCGSCCGSCWTDVTQNYAGQSNFTFAGIVFQSVDQFGVFAGQAVRANDPGCGGNFGGYYLYSSSCGGQSAQGPFFCCC